MTGQQMQEVLIAAVKASTTEVFKTMLGMEMKAGEIYHTGAQEPNEGVVSLIGLAGPWMGTGSIRCSPRTACSLSGALMMSEYSTVDEEVFDAIAEITNMVIGNVKTALEEHVGPMGLSIPTVIYGRNFSTKSAGTNNWTVVPFTCGEDSISVHVYLVANTEGKKAPRIGFTNPQLSTVC